MSNSKSNEDDKVEIVNNLETDLDTTATQAQGNKRRPSFNIKEKFKRKLKKVKSKKEKEQEDEDLLYGAKHIIMLFAPVTLCMLIVVLSVNSFSFYSRKDKTISQVLPFKDDDGSGEGAGSRVITALLNSLVVLGFVVFATFFFFFLYKYRCYKVIYAWVSMSFVIIFGSSYIYIEQILNTYNMPLDLITIAIIWWNFGVGGIFCIHLKGPLLVQQGYLIMGSALVALLIIKILPGFTAWGVLSILVFWDLVAVLCPGGPLRMLVETAEERNEPLFPALIYSSAMVWTIMMSESGGQPAVDRQQTDETQTKAKAEMSENAGDTVGDLRESAATAVSASAEEKSGKPAEEDKGAALTSTQVSGDVDLVTINAVETLDDYGSSSVDPVMVVKKKKKKIKTANKVKAPVPDGEAQPGAESASVPQPAQRIETGEMAAAKTQPQAQDDDDGGINLGLGDFIFYSVLVGKASSDGDWVTTLACFVSILIGLCCTLFLLAIYKKALPALPISLTFGLTFNFATRVFVQPFLNKYTSEQVFI